MADTPTTQAGWCPCGGQCHHSPNPCSLSCLMPAQPTARIAELEAQVQTLQGEVATLVEALRDATLRFHYDGNHVLPFDECQGMWCAHWRAALSDLSAASEKHDQDVARRAVETWAGSPEQLAQRFHAAYERFAPSFGYETRRASAVPWADVPEKNRALMVATCAALLATDAEDRSPDWWKRVVANQSKSSPADLTPPGCTHDTHPCDCAAEDPR